MFTTGEVEAIGALDDTAFSGYVHRAVFTAISIDRHLLTEVAGPPHRGQKVSLTSSALVSADASQHLVDVIDHVRHTVVIRISRGNLSSRGPSRAISRRQC